MWAFGLQELHPSFPPPLRKDLVHPAAHSKQFKRGMPHTLRMIPNALDEHTLFISREHKNRAPKSPVFAVNSVIWLTKILQGDYTLVHLKCEKTTSNLRKSENGWREKYQFCMNSTSILACCQNPMGLETTVWLNFYIHSALLPYPMVCEEFLTTELPNLFSFSFNPLEDLCKNEQKGSILFGT